MKMCSDEFFLKHALKSAISYYLTILLIACGLIVLSSARAISDCKIGNCAMKLKFIHKISGIQEKVLVFFYLVR